MQNLADETEAAVQEEAEAQRSQEYWDNMAAMAAEAEANPGRWMSEEEKAELAEQEQKDLSESWRERWRGSGLY